MPTPTPSAPGAPNRRAAAKRAATSPSSTASPAAANTTAKKEGDGLLWAAIILLVLLLVGVAGFRYRNLSSSKAAFATELEKEKADRADDKKAADEAAKQAKKETDAALAKVAEDAKKAVEDLKKQMLEQEQKANKAIADAQKAPPVVGVTAPGALPPAAGAGMGFTARLVTQSSVPNAEMRNPEAFSRAHVGAQIDILHTTEIYSRENGQPITGHHCIYFRFPGNKPGAEYYCNVDLKEQGIKLPLDLTRLEAAGYTPKLVRVKAQPNDYIRPEDAARGAKLHTRGTLVWMKAGPMPPLTEIGRMAEQKS